jgi:hypothetical protein
MKSNEIEINGEVYIKKDSIKNETKIETVKVCEGTPFKIGVKYLIRTVTMIYTGKLEKIYNKELVFSTCAWIPDTGRWSDAVEKGTFSEIEPYPINSEVIINRDVILDICDLNYDLPKTKK